MDIQFEKKPLHTLQSILHQTQSTELTQEIRLPEELPDIGRVVCAWAQPLIRGKEWLSDRIGVSGGVLCWVLYVPEEGSGPQSVSAWLPFQLRWDIPPSAREGAILAQSFVRSTDARSLSARKIMVRAGIALTAQALVPESVDIAVPTQLPEDVELLRKEMPICIPAEVGEKTFEMEDSFSIPGTMPEPGKVIRFFLHPVITDQKLMGDKAVFRGTGHLHLLYRCREGKLHAHTREIPFSQYSELDGDYPDEAQLQILPMVTNLELDLDADGKLHLKAGLSGQYTVFDHRNLELVEDAYSVTRPVKLQTEDLQLPLLLGRNREKVQVLQSVDADVSRSLDLAVYPDTPTALRTETELQTLLPGTFQLLYRDMDDQLRCTHAYWEETQIIPLGLEERTATEITVTGQPQMADGGAAVTLSAEITSDTALYGGGTLSQVTGLTLERECDPDPDRPSLILRKAGGDSLWQIAKSTGSTPEKIRTANTLTGEPHPDQVLLIPIP